MSSSLQKTGTPSVTKEKLGSPVVVVQSEESSSKRFGVSKDHTVKRHLNSRTVQMIAMGGSIGTGLFVTIGGGLTKAGPAGLFIAFLFWTTVILFLTCSIGEMVCYLPTASPFVEMAGKAVDEAFEATAGWNFFLMEACYIPFEITACNSMVHYWRDDYSPGIAFAVQIALYLLFNVFTVRWFGESEFVLTLGKVFLCIGLLFFTFITMVGGNPQHDAFGFRYWNNPGAFGEYITTGDLGRFEGFLGALFGAAFVCVGPEYLSMVAGEAGTGSPRRVMKSAFKSVLYRLVLFYVGGALSVSILISYQDPTLVLRSSAGTSNAAGSPYVIAMQNMGIKGLPDLVNVVIILSAFSAGNSYFYCSSRQLYSLSKRGFAPASLQMCTPQGIPIFCVLVSTCFALLSLLQLGDSASVVLTWIVSLCTGAQILNYAFMTVIYYCFYRACKVQGIDRNKFIYKAWFQPYATYVVGFFMWIMVFIIGYAVFLPGGWSVSTFLFNYVMIFVDLAIYLFWKVLKRTKWIKPEDADLVTGLAEIEEYEYEFHAKLAAEGKPATNDDSWYARIMRWVF